MSTGQSIKSLNHFYFKMVKNFLKNEGFQIFLFLGICQGLLFAFYKSFTPPALLLGMFDPYLTAGAFLTLLLSYYTYPKFLLDDQFLKTCLPQLEALYWVRVFKFLLSTHLKFIFISFIPLIQNRYNLITLLTVSTVFGVSSLLIPLLLKKSGSKSFVPILQSTKKIKKQLKNKTHAIARLSVIYLLRKNRKYMGIAFFYSICAAAGVLLYVINQQPDSLLFYLCLPYVPLIGTALAINAEVYQGLVHFTHQSKKIGFWIDFLIWYLLSLALWIVITGILLLMPGGFTLEALLIPVLLLIGWLYIFMVKFLYLENHLLKSMSLALTIVVPLAIPIFFVLFIREVYFDKS